MDSARVGRTALLAAVALLATAWQVAAAPAPDDTRDLHKQALQLNEVTGDDPIKGAIQDLVDKPDSTRKLLKLALEMSKEKEQPFNYNALYILARTAQKLKESSTSESFYRLAAAQALELQSGNKLVQTYGGLIDLLFENKKYAETEKVCRDFLGLRGDDTVDRLKVLVLRRLIQTLAKEEKFDEAKKLVDSLVKAQPDNWLSLELRGWVERESGDYDASAKTYEDVLKRINDDKDLKDDERKEFADEIRYNLSNVYLEMNKIDKVTENLETLIKDEPDNPTYYNDLGYIWADHDMHLDKAEEMIRKALELDRKLRKEIKPPLAADQDHDNGAYLDSLGWVLYKQKKYKEAKAPLQEAVKDKDSQHIEIYDHLGDVLMALGEKPEAIAAWKKGLEVVGPTKREQERKTEVEKKLKNAEQ